MDSELVRVELNIRCIQDSTVYVKENIKNISKRKLESLKKIADLQKYYQCNPVRFINDFFNVELFDAQAWIVQATWTCPQVLIVATRGLGKSTIIDLILMAKGMLFNNYWSYIASGSGSQAQQTFMTLEKLANDNIDTMVGSTGYIFKQELEVPNAIGDGFSHSSDGFRYGLYNGSTTMTLNSNINRKRGIRGNVVFDETGWLSAEMLHTYAAFAVVNKSFKTGKDAGGNALDPVRMRTIPRELPYQVFYISSASSSDTEFYRLYRQFAKKMFMGDKNYFVAHLDCEVAFSPTMRGKKIPPLLSRETVETAMKANPEKGRREYFCEFTSDAGAQAIVKRAVITRNSEVRKPLLGNDTGKKKFILTYDPARLSDNSVILVGELYDNSDEGYEVRLVNCINLVDIHKKKKTPVTIPNQIDILRETILEYNAGGDEFYSNIVAIYIDAGAGGQAGAIADLLTYDWKDAKGVTHKGLVDVDYDELQGKNFPNAVQGKLHMMPPATYKSEMFEKLIQMTGENHIKFTAEYDNKGYLTIVDIDSKLYEKEKKQLTEKYRKEGYEDQDLEEKVSEGLALLQNTKVHMETLSFEEEVALSNIDLVKDQIVNIQRIKRNGSKDGFELVPEKINTMHDDHAYTLAMMGYALAVIRRKQYSDKNKSKNKGKFSITDLVANSSIHKQRHKSIF